MKKYFLLGILAVLMILCACKKSAAAAPEASTTAYTPNPRVQSITPGEKTPADLTSRKNKREGVTRRDAISATKRTEDEIVTLHYNNGDTVIDQELTADESATIISMMSARREKSEASTEAFREDVCFEISGHRFAIATDQSGFILNYETGNYIALSGENRQVIDTICAAYGAIFPCE